MDNKKIIKLLEDINQKLVLLNCNVQEIDPSNFDITTLSPPIDAPVGDDPIVLFNSTTGVIYYWDGNSWEVFGTADTNAFTNDLAQTGTRTHDGGGYDFNVIGTNNLSWDADTQILLRWIDVGGDYASITANGGGLSLSANIGGFFSTITINPGSGGISLTDGEGKVTIPVLNSDPSLDTILVVDNNGTIFVRTLTQIEKTSVGFTADGGGSDIPTGKVKGFFTCPYSGTISAWNIVADAGTCTIRVWKIATGTAKPTSGDEITTNGLDLSSGTAIHSTDVTDFTTVAVAANDIFAFEVDTLSGMTELSFGLQINKT